MHPGTAAMEAPQRQAGYIPPICRRGAVVLTVAFSACGCSDPGSVCTYPGYFAAAPSSEVETLTRVCAWPARRVIPVVATAGNVGPGPRTGCRRCWMCKPRQREAVQGRTRYLPHRGGRVTPGYAGRGQPANQHAAWRWVSARPVAWAPCRMPWLPPMGAGFPARAMPDVWQ